jgi:hypothetical protein
VGGELLSISHKPLAAVVDGDDGAKRDLASTSDDFHRPPGHRVKHFFKLGLAGRWCNMQWLILTGHAICNSIEEEVRQAPKRKAPDDGNGS